MQTNSAVPDAKGLQAGPEIETDQYDAGTAPEVKQLFVDIQKAPASDGGCAGKDLFGSQALHLGIVVPGMKGQNQIGDGGGSAVLDKFFAIQS